MADGDIWIEPGANSAWSVRIEEEEQAFDFAASQIDAIQKGREVARRASVALVILNASGLLQEQVSYRSTSGEAESSQARISK